jgi:hypothetical protein
VSDLLIMYRGITSAELTIAIERLYEVFARYKVRGPVPGCSCCVPEAMSIAIARVPLRTLDHNGLYLYSHKAMTTWGDVDHFRYFLPRLCELICLPDDDENQSRRVEVDWLCMKLDGGKWREWPQVEQDAIAGYLLALWREIIVRGQRESPSFSVAIDLFGSLQYCTPNFRPLLEACLESLTPTSVRALAEIATNQIALNRRQMVNATQAGFWDEVRESLPGVVEVLTSTDTTQRLEAEFFDETSAVDKSELSEAIEAIGRLRKMVSSAT